MHTSGARCVCVGGGGGGGGAGADPTNPPPPGSASWGGGGVGKGVKHQRQFCSGYFAPGYRSPNAGKMVS